VNSNGKPVAAQYCATFLKPEMLHIYRQITTLRRYDPVVLTQRRENGEHYPFNPVLIMNRPWTREIRRFWQKKIRGGPLLISRKEARGIDHALKAASADLLHIYFGHIGVHLLPYLRRARVPVIVSFHGADAGVDVRKRAHLRALQEVFQRSALVLCRSEAIVQNLLALGCPPAKLRIHRTGIPLARFPFIQRRPPANGDWRLVQACRLIPKKGLDTTLKAFAEFQRTYPGARLTIAGEGPLAGALEGLALGLGIGGKVSFPGFVSQARLRELLDEAHVFIHPSVTGPDGDREGVPNALLEAMASGIPVASTRHGGIPEAVTDRETGLLVEENAPEALAEALASLATQPGMYEEMSANAGRSVAVNWEIEAQSRRLEELYDEARHCRP
jgi:glycosyltransferase involved in cell wall biosynthesis